MADRSMDTKALRETAQMKHLQGAIEGLKADLDSAVEVAFLRGATEWVRINYPSHYERLLREWRNRMV